MSKKLVLMCAICLIAALALSACTDTGGGSSASPSAAASESTVVVEKESGSADTTPVSGKWTDPLTEDVLEMKDGGFTLTDKDGEAVNEGTYTSSKTENTYDVTYGDGTKGTFTVDDTVIKFKNADGSTTTFESTTAQ